MASAAVARGFLDETERAEAHWGLPLCDRQSFIDRLRQIVSSEPDAVEALGRVHVNDLYLAHACARGSRRAIDLFVHKYLRDVAKHLSRFAGASAQVDDVRRELEDLLLLGKGDSRPRIGQYAGRGSLERFVATAARNVFRSLLRGRPLQSLDEHSAGSRALVSPPHGSKPLVAARYERHIREAVRVSLGSLDQRQRTILRLHLSQGITLTRIATMLRVHQSTVSRALEAAMERMHSEIRRTLRDVHGLRDTEMDSIIRDLRSQMDLSLSRVLRETR